MRYFVVTYYLKADGQYDEVVQTVTTVGKTLQRTANVIMNFEKREVVKARLEQPIERDWSRIRDYYHKLYAQIIDSLEDTTSPGNDAPNEN